MINQSPAQSHPIELFDDWFHKARETESEDADAACISSVGPDGMPSSRMVLMRIVDERGFTFFTNFTSQKGKELLAHPKAAICYHWKSLRRQVRVQGLVEKISDQEADDYYNQRPRGSRIAAWASDQSSSLPDRETLMARVAEFEEKFKNVENPPRPPHWSGFRIVPERIEFWEQHEFRLHERLVFIKDGDQWRTDTLYP